MKVLHRSSCPSNATTPASLGPEANVRVLSWFPEPSSPDAEDHNPPTYRIRDGLGRIIDMEVTVRKEAVRCLGVYAVRGLPAPLVLLAPNGQPTGDRIA